MTAATWSSSSSAPDLVPGVPAGVGQVYVAHLDSGTVELASVSSTGEPAALNAGQPTISADGRFVVFQSFSTNLTPDGLGYLFIRDLQSGTTSVIPDSGSNQSQAPTISPDGRFVFFHRGYTYRVVHDRRTGTTAVVDIPSTYAASWARWSDDGRWLAVYAEDGLRSNSYRLWVWDRLTGSVTEETRTDAGAPVTTGADGVPTWGRPGISGDGRIVGFWTTADGVVAGDTGGLRDVFVRDRGDVLGPAVSDVAVTPSSPVGGEQVTLTATADDTGRGGSVIAAADYRIGSGDWVPMAALDGGFDSAREQLMANVPGLPGGTSSICVRATDGRGNVTVPPACTDVIVDEAAGPVAATVVNVVADAPTTLQPFARIGVMPGELPDVNALGYDSVDDPSVRRDVADDGDLFATYGSQVVSTSGTAAVVLDVGFLRADGGRTRMDLNPIEGVSHLVVSVDLDTGRWQGLDGDGNAFEAPTSCVRSASTPDPGTVAGHICFAVSALSLSGDADGDGLLDAWELFGVSTDPAVPVELDLPGWGASPDHKDLFIQYDVEDDARFDSRVEDGLIAVQEAFALAPVDAGGVDNPDGQPGIRLWIDSPSTDSALSLEGSDRDRVVTGEVCSVGDDEFYTVKSAVFDANRRWVFRWALKELEDEVDLCGRGGQAEISGNDMLILNHDQRTTLSDGTAWPGGETFMHELGHMLNLKHGGFENANYKPNYVSLMNYRYVFTLHRPNGGDGFLDFSPVRQDPPAVGVPGDRPSTLLPNLDEGALPVEVVLGADHAADLSWADTACALTVAPADDPFDVDPLVAGPDSPVSHPGFNTPADDLPETCEGASEDATQTHRDHDDWTALVLPIDALGDYSDAPTNPSDDDGLPTNQEIEALRAAVRTTDLRLEASGPDTPVRSPTAVQLTVTNERGIPANALTVRIDAPAEVTVTGEGCSADGVCTRGALPGGADVGLSLSVSGPAGSHRLSFTVEGRGTLDADPGNNRDGIEVTFVREEPSPSVSPSAGQSSRPTPKPTPGLPNTGV